MHAPDLGGASGPLSSAVPTLPAAGLGKGGLAPGDEEGGGLLDCSEGGGGAGE